MDSKLLGVIVMVVFLIEAYICVEILWLGITLAVITMGALIYLSIRKRRKRKENLHKQIEQIHKSRHPEGEES